MKINIFLYIMLIINILRIYLCK